MGGLLLYIIGLVILLIGSCALWSFLLHKTTLRNVETGRKNAISGLFFGIIAIVAANMGDIVDNFYAGTFVLRNAGIVPVCAGLFFGGSAGMISAAMGSVHELVALIASGGESGQLSDMIVTLLAGASVMLISGLLLRKRKPSITICIISSLEVSALNIVVYPLTTISVSSRLSQLLVGTTISMYLVNIIGILGSLMVFRKITTGRFRAGKSDRNGSMKASRLAVLIGTAFLVITTAFIFVSLTAISRRITVEEMTAEMDAAEAFINNNPDVSKEKAGEYVGYNPGDLIVADSAGNVLSYTEDGIDTLADMGIMISEYASEDEVYTVQLGGKSYLMEFRRVGEFILVDKVSEEVAYSFREPLILFIISLEILIVYMLIILMSMLIQRELVLREEEINRSLDRIMGRNTNKAGNEVYSITGADVTGYMKEIVDRIEGEMKFAGDIQMQSLPIRTAMTNGICIKALVKPARDIGGDFYDYFSIDGNRIAFLVADISGKGISAAMFMMRAKAAIRGAASLENEAIIDKVNDILYEGNADEMFVTAWVGIMDPLTGVVQYVNAAQGNKIYRDADGEYRLIEDDPEAPIGVRKGKKYTIRTLHMHPGSRLFLYTDGVTDANNADGEMYGEERMLAYLNENCKTANGEETVDGFLEELQSYMGIEEQFDDITLMAVDYFGQSEDFEYAARTFIAANENLDEATDFINEALDSLGCSDGQLMEIDVAFEELFVNISNYAYPEKPGDVKVEVSVTHGMATIRLTDSGFMFNPLRQKGPDNTIPLKEKKEGGLGITMVKTCMNYTDYKYEDEKNIFTMIKLIH